MASPEILAAEQFLVNDFSEFVGSISLGDVAAVPSGLRARYASNVDQYSIVPIVGTREGSASLDPVGYDYILPEWCHADTVHNMPPMDARYGMGLFFKLPDNEDSGRIVALSAAGIPYDGPPRMRLVQVQGIARRWQPHMQGLKGGLLWRDTFLNAWRLLCNRLEVPLLEIETGEKHLWWKESRRELFHRNYDQFAETNGFVRDRGGDWISPV